MRMILMLILCMMCATSSFAAETAVKIVNGGIQFPVDGSTQNRSASPPVCADGEVLASYSGSWHCGSIKIVTNGVATCTQGGCSINACNSGFKSCDNNADNGCETNLLNDSQNCGACGNACQGFGNCESGICANPLQLLSLTPSVSTVTVGESVAMLVTMSKAVPSDFAVMLNNSIPATASIPPVVTILTGQSTGQFFATAAEYGSTTITASALGNNVTAQVDVVPLACGDGIKVGPEACDDGNITNGDGCSDFCQIEVGYSCNGSPSTCNPLCGNGILNVGELCDDANLTNGDGCSSTCQSEIGMIELSGLPPVVVTGVPVSLTLTAKNLNGSISAAYRGTVLFASDSLGTVTLPAMYTFVAADNGIKIFNGVTFYSLGFQTVFAVDVNNAILNSSQSTSPVNPD